MITKKTIRSILVLAGVWGLLLPINMSADSSKTVKVFLLGGQSNMNGTGSELSDLVPPYNALPPQIKIWDLTEKAWTNLPLMDAVFGPPKQTRAAFGPELSFGHAMTEAFPGSDIRLIKYAANGTALYNDWAPGTGSQYKAFMETVKAALNDLSSNGIPYEIVGMLWLQGESDAKEEMGVDYEKNLMAFIEHVRTEFNEPGLPFIIARVRDFYGKGIHADMVREAQAFVAEMDPQAAWFDTDDCGPLVQGGHYGSGGLIEIGLRFAESFRSLGGKPECVEPALEGGVTIGLIGDSTVATTYGWGPAFAARCSESVNLLNYAKNGATLNSIPYRLDALLKQKPDYVLIQFGHNDMKVYGPDAYREKLKGYVDRITQTGGKAILLSSVTRRNFGRDGLVKPLDIDGRSLPDYARAVESLAGEEGLPFIDLYSLSVAHHNKIGPEASALYNPSKKDKTHFSKAGAQAIAELIIEALPADAPELAPYVSASR